MSKAINFSELETIEAAEAVEVEGVLEVLAQKEGVQLLQWQPQTIEAATAGMFQDLNNTVFISFKDPQTKENKAKIFNALNNVDNPLSNFIGHELAIVDLIHHKYESIDADTGEVQLKYRNILIDENGNLFNTISYGVNAGLRSLLSIYGMPQEWEEPLKIRPIRGQGNKLKIELVTE